jgi:hypothetical protein
MKHFNQNILLSGILLLLIASCKKAEIASPASSAAVSQSSSTSAAYSFNTQSNIDLTQPGWYEVNSCTGEHLSINSGIWHIDIHGVINGNKVSFTKHTNVQHYKLQSAVTGLVYNGSYESTDKYDVTFFNGLFISTSTLSVQLTTAGGGNNSVLKVDEHITINANGNLNRMA